MGPLNHLSHGIGVDLGTANTLIYLSGQGIVLNEPSVVALDQTHQTLLAIGTEAEAMWQRNPSSILVSHPLADGVIVGFETARLMLKHFIQQVQKGQTLLYPRVIISSPVGATSIEKRALAEVAAQAGAREVYLIEEPIAAAIGANLPVEEPIGNMIVDIGGGTTEIAVVSYMGTVVTESLRIAGNQFDQVICRHVKQNHDLLIGEKTAETVKIALGIAYPHPEQDEAILEISGLRLLSGLPGSVVLKGLEIREALAESLARIVAAIKRVLEKIPPELAADLIDRGIVITGGGALLKGLDALIRYETGLVVHIASDPCSCVALGTGKVLENFKQWERVLQKRL